MRGTHGVKYLVAMAGFSEADAEDLKEEVIKKLGGLDYEDDLLPWYEAFEAKNKDLEASGVPSAKRYADDRRAYLACNDRYYLLIKLLGRVDMQHRWLCDRCREVEENPYGYLDLWARAHGKSSIITTAGIIQEIIRDPEVTIAIFSATKPLSQEFLAQIKNEFETNEDLKRIFADVLYENPRGRDQKTGRCGRPSGVLPAASPSSATGIRRKRLLRRMV